VYAYWRSAKRSIKNRAKRSNSSFSTRDLTGKMTTCRQCFLNVPPKIETFSATRHWNTFERHIRIDWCCFYYSLRNCLCIIVTIVHFTLCGKNLGKHFLTPRCAPMRNDIRAHAFEPRASSYTSITSPFRCHQPLATCTNRWPRLVSTAIELVRWISLSAFRYAMATSLWQILWPCV